MTGRVHYDKIMEDSRGKDLPKCSDQALYCGYTIDLTEIAAIVGRARATSLAEITALGIPTILILVHMSHMIIKWYSIFSRIEICCVSQ